jgi:acyl-Coa thioesterase superfamily protein/acyl-CoA thioesterase superfamily protein
VEPDAFYEPDGERYLSSELTRGPWDPGSQHAGPPAALISREIERLGDGRIGGGDGPPARVGRITYEILRPVPIAPLEVSAEIVRPGRKVEMAEAVLSDESGPLIRARGWRVRAAEVDLGTEPDLGEPPPGIDQASHKDFFPTGHDVGYHAAIDYRFVEGSFTEAGPAKVWLRMKHALVAGEEPSPLTRVMIVADSGNGVSAALDWRKYLFINVDLTVHLHRLPAGEWVYLDAKTYPQSDGIGMSDTQIADEAGPIGRAAQTLLIDRR